MKNVLFSQKSLDEIVFENRNKSYGAYNLRQAEAQILQKSLFLGISLFASIVAVPVVANFLKTETVVHKTPPIVFDVQNVDQPQQRQTVQRATVKPATETSAKKTGRILSGTKGKRAFPTSNFISTNRATFVRKYRRHPKSYDWERSWK